MSAVAAALGTAFIASVGYESALLAELRPRARPVRWPAVVAVSDAATTGDPVFARQILPGATLVKGDSVGALAAGAFTAVAAAIESAPAFTLQAYVPDPEAYAAHVRRAAQVGDELRGLLRERQPRAFDNLRDDDPLDSGVLVVQLALVARTSLVVSAAFPRRLPRGGWDLAPWPAGIAPVAEDRAAPSRAYGKFEEGLAWLGAAPAAGETCVDLGGAPGGWAWKALQRGASVIAVDRATLAPTVTDHPALTMVRGDAFRYEPPAPVDWLLCDVICEPARTLGLVEAWLSRGWARRVVATVKFKGNDGYGILPATVQRLAALQPGFLRVKHLYRHHNEVVILASTR
jgi:23S rRNA (cytidine2498-2'-O)-methyltransferase